jgi:hypothetical protein
VIGKSPLLVTRQHGHSVETMWRTYAAWMDGAVESDIALIKAAMVGHKSIIERMSNPKIESNSDVSAVAGFGTRIATRHDGPGAQVPENRGQRKWRRGWKPIWHGQVIEL